MDYFTEYKLSKYKEIEPLSDKGTTVLVYDTVERQLFVKKVVNEKIYKIYKKISDIECKYMPKIIDTIKAEDEYIIIEEFIKGDSVDYLIKQNGVFSEEKAVSYIIDIGEALKQIHGRNIVHRDITPNNVIIDENDSAVLLDFDIARMEDKSESRDTTLLGTAGFASPEQYGFAPTDTRGDIFSMGALLNFMLTGDVVQKKIYTKTGLYNVISKSIQIDPENRYNRIEEFIIDVSAYCPEKIVTEKNSKLLYKITYHLPGFRTNIIYKKVIAIILYFVFLWDAYNTIFYRKMSFKEGLNEIIFLFLLFIFPMWFFGARGRIMKKIPMLRELKPIPRFIAAAVLYFFFLLLFGTTF